MTGRIDTSQSVPDQTAQAFFWNSSACAAFADAVSVRFAEGDDKPGEVRHLEAHFAHMRIFLLAQGIELAVKAWLLQDGVPADTLRSRDIGHDLAALLALAGRRSFPHAGEAERWLVDVLNATYRDGKRLQYPKPEPASWPSPRAVRELLHDSLRAAGASIFPDIDLDRVCERDNVAWAGMHIDPRSGYWGNSLAALRERVSHRPAD